MQTEARFEAAAGELLPRSVIRTGPIILARRPLRSGWSSLPPYSSLPARIQTRGTPPRLATAARYQEKPEPRLLRGRLRLRLETPPPRHVPQRCDAGGLRVQREQLLVRYRYRLAPKGNVKRCPTTSNCARPRSWSRHCRRSLNGRRSPSARR